jgi:transposase
MAISEDLRSRVVRLVKEEGLSRRAAADRMRVSAASAVRWTKEYETSGCLRAKRSGGDHRSGRIEEHASYILGVVKRQPDMTAKELRERLINNGTGTFSTSVIWRFLARKGLTYKKRQGTPTSSAARM